MEQAKSATRQGISHLRLLNFRSVAAVDITLQPFTIFVGPNASGKSNILRSLSFLKNALASQLRAALDVEGGVTSVVRQMPSEQKAEPGARSSMRPDRVLDLGLSVRFGLFIDGAPCEVEYGFVLATDWLSSSRYRVSRERCKIFGVDSGLSQPIFGFDRDSREVITYPELPVPRLAGDRLALPLLTGIARFATVYDALTSVAVYAIAPNTIRDLQTPDSGQRLEADGHNLASVLREIRRNDPPRYGRLLEFLSAAIPGQIEVRERQQGDKLGLRFEQQLAEGRLSFDAFEMSDGTLRLLALLAAAYQQPTPLVVGIEEPESTIHPSAMGVLLDIFRNASEQTQVLITTHSPDILEDKDLPVDAIRLVEWREGVTSISSLGQAAAESVTEGLMLAGELLRSNALRPDRSSEARTVVNLFPEW